MIKKINVFIEVWSQSNYYFFFLIFNISIYILIAYNNLTVIITEIFFIKLIY